MRMCLCVWQVAGLFKKAAHVAVAQKEVHTNTHTHTHKHTHTHTYTHPKEVVKRQGTGGQMLKSDDRSS